MTIAFAAATSNICWLDIVVVSNKYGVPCLRISGSSSVKPYRPDSIHYIGPLRIVQVSSLDDLRRSKLLSRIIASKSVRAILVLTVSDTDAVSSGLSSILYPGLSLSKLDEVVSMAVSDCLPEVQEINLVDRECEEKKILEKNQRDSILQKVTQNLYRLPNKDHRLDIQTRIYRFLSGALKKPPVTGMKNLDDTLNSELAFRFRDCCLATVNRHADETSLEFQVDRFEVGYVIRKVCTDQRMLSNIEFRD